MRGDVVRNQPTETCTGEFQLADVGALTVHRSELAAVLGAAVPGAMGRASGS